MFEYFPDNYPWSMAALMTLNAGAVMSEIDEACRGLKPLAGANDDAANEAWHANWSAMGARNERLAQVDEAAGNKLSAGEKYLRAAVYFMTAERMCKSDDPKRLETYKRMLSCFRTGIEQRGDAMEWVEVPYKNTSLPALFVPAQSSEPTPPCLIHFDGLDVMKEFLYLSRVPHEYNRRGVSVLLIDHPGVGEALRLRDLKLFPEVEIPAAAAVDYLQGRADTDAERIGIAGTGTALSVSHWVEHMNWVFGTASADEFLDTARRMNLAEAAPKIQCPLLVVHGAGDRQIPVQMAHNTVDHATSSPRADLKIFGPEDGGVEHCQCDNGKLAVEYMTDRVAEVLNAQPIYR